MTQIIDPSTVGAAILATAPTAPTLPPTVPASSAVSDVASSAADNVKTDAPADAGRWIIDKATGKPKLHPRTGKPMPKSPGRGGNKPKAPAPSPASSTPAPSTAPASAASPAEPSPWNEADRKGANASSSAGNDAAGSPSPDGGAPKSPDATLSPEATGDLACKTLYSLTGAVIGDHKAATATGAEHAALSANIGAYCKHRGILFTGTIALIGFAVAYALSDDRRGLIIAKIRSFFGPKKSVPRPVNQEPIDIKATPVPQPRDPFA